VSEGLIDLSCLNCNRPETVIPLVNLRYSGRQAWICSQCLPILIHNPQKLAGRLKGAENMDPAPEVDESGET
jgi:hypothetical protein